jgi:hypothetical protein
MADNFQVKDANGNTITMRSTDVGGGIELPNSRPNDGTNPLSKFFDLDTSGSTHEYNLGVGIRISASGGSVEAKGQAAMAASLPVVIASDQSNVGTNLAKVNGTTTDSNSGTKSAGTLRVVIATDQPALSNKLLVTPDSVALPAHQSTNVDQWAGTSVDVNSGLKSAGTLRVVLATDQPALTNKLLVTPDSVALPAHQSTNVDQWNGTTVDTNSGTKSAGTLRVVIATDQPQLTNKLLVTPDALPSHQSTNVDQWAGTTVDTNSGNKSAGTLRVVLATDQPANTNNLNVNVNAAIAAGTNTIGNVGNVPLTSGGLSIYRNINLGTSGVNIKASAGQVYGWFIANNASSARFVKFYNKATAPTVGTDTPVMTLEIPANASANVSFVQGIAFGTGIGIGATNLVADADTTAPSSNDLVVNILYN